MVKWMLAAGAAAVALTAPALAGPGHGGGGGGPKGEQGGGPKNHGGGDKGQRGGGGHMRDEYGGGQQIRLERGNGGGKHAQREAMRVDRGKGGGNHTGRQAMRAAHGNDGSKHAERALARHEDKQARGLRGLDRSTVALRGDGRAYAGNDQRGFGGYDNTCPPGLARKDNGCLPPGHAKRIIGFALPAALGSRTLAGPFSQWYRDNDQYYYRNDSDYIYRVNRAGGLVDALFPYRDQSYNYYPVGANYPADFNYYNVPQQYQSYYPDGNDYSYRYGDGAIYQVNRSNNRIDSIVALLAGDLGVGQQMPSDYGVYNVPMAYRDRYYDTPDATYRYNDGYIYQADPKTQLITAVIDALV